MARTRRRSAEAERLREDARRQKNWKRWGPYLAERQWGTVREDYSQDGSAWNYFTYDQSMSRAYRWGEDGLLGITDRECRLCFALALWNERDPHLKERLFGLTGPEGNHGEDVKEEYFYLDSTPTHSYMKALYKYPQAEFPYAMLREENRRRGLKDPEFELRDTGIFDGGRYFDVFVEYGKASPDDILIRLSVLNRGPEKAPVHILPTLWFRNTWVWGCRHEGCWVKPRMQLLDGGEVLAQHVTLGRFRLVAGSGPDGRMPLYLFTENETNVEKLFAAPNGAPYVKDAFHRFIVHGEREAVNPRYVGTKAAAHYRLDLPSGEGATIQLRLFAEKERPQDLLGTGFEHILDGRVAEADEFYSGRSGADATVEERNVVRQAYAGLLWTKQFYHYVVEDWLDGDPQMPPPPETRKLSRNSDWRHFFSRDVLSMPDKWEYPWFAAWDLAFHAIPLARIDPEYAKAQLLLLLREWYMHPNGALPAYEFAFSDVNPPVHAWACWRVYKITGQRGKRDRFFLARAFQKLLMNFTWWVNRKDDRGKHIFSGGFLGLDNIGLFDRSKPLPGGGTLEQADGTAWMAFYCGTMLAMALELAQQDPAYEDIASKFFEHFIAIADAMNFLGGTGLWDDGDGFYYDQFVLDGKPNPLRVRSLVGLIPLIAVELLENDVIERLPGFKKRMEWFLANRRDLARFITYLDLRKDDREPHTHRILAIPSRERLERVLRYLLDEQEFLSPFGFRSLSRYHQAHPYVFLFHGKENRVGYAPGEADTWLFGGNSNWRGPIWLPVNYLLVEALERYDHFYGETLLVEFPTGSGRRVRLGEVAREIAGRLTRLFIPDGQGRRPCHGDSLNYALDPHWRDLVLFHEFFHGDTGKGLGASHQTGWTSLVVRLLECTQAE